MHKRIRALFDTAMVYQAHIPSYPSGHWLFGFASKGPHPVRDLKAGRWNGLGLETMYYNTDLHLGAFALPNYVYEQLEAEDE
jgi:spermidine synthase